MVFEKVKQIIAEQLNISEENINEDTIFTDDLGADSLDIFQIITALEEEFEIEISNEEIENMSTVKDAVNYIKNNLPKE